MGNMNEPRPLQPGSEREGVETHPAKMLILATEISAYTRHGTQVDQVHANVGQVTSRALVHIDHLSALRLGLMASFHWYI